MKQNAYIRVLQTQIFVIYVLIIIKITLSKYNEHISTAAK